MPAPTPSAGLPAEYAALTMAFPPVARMTDTPSCRISAPVASSEGFSIHWTQCSGAPAATAASRTILAASALQRWAAGWNANTMGLRVFNASRALKIVVEVGLVTGVTPQTTPTGSAISTMPLISSRDTTPTVLRSAMLWVTCSQAKMFLTALSSNRPRPVSSTARRASAACRSSAATDAFLTMWSTCSWVKDSYSVSAFSAPVTSVSIAACTSAGRAAPVGESVIWITSWGSVGRIVTFILLMPARPHRCARAPPPRTKVIDSAVVGRPGPSPAKDGDHQAVAASRLIGGAGSLAVANSEASPRDQRDFRHESRALRSAASIAAPAMSTLVTSRPVASRHGRQP